MYWFFCLYHLFKILIFIYLFPDFLVLPLTPCVFGQSWCCVFCGYCSPAITCRLISIWHRSGWSKWGKRRGVSLPLTSRGRWGWNVAQSAGVTVYDKLTLYCNKYNDVMFLNSFMQVTRIFCYLTVVTLQYLIPILLVLFSTLALKSLGGSLHFYWLFNNSLYVNLTSKL